MKYRYTINGTGAGGTTWRTEGQVEIDKAGLFGNVPHEAMMASFNQLTQGKAIYGNPGVGCRGPYDVTSMLIEKLPGK